MESLKGFDWNTIGISIGFLGAAMAVGLPCSGSAKGVGRVGEAGSGLLTVEPSKFSRILIFQILPGTQGLYGLVVWFLALMKLGFFSGALIPLTMMEGIKFFAACMPVAIGGYIFGGTQGRICANGLAMVAKRQSDLSKSIIMAIMMEFYSILAFLATFLMLNNF